MSRSLRLPLNGGGPIQRVEDDKKASNRLLVRANKVHTGTRKIEKERRRRWGVKEEAQNKNERPEIASLTFCVCVCARLALACPWLTLSYPYSFVFVFFYLSPVPFFILCPPTYAFTWFSIKHQDSIATSIQFPSLYHHAPLKLFLSYTSSAPFYSLQAFYFH